MMLLLQSRAMRFSITLAALILIDRLFPPRAYSAFETLMLAAMWTWVFEQREGSASA